MNKDDFDNFTVEDSKKWGILSFAVGSVVFFVAQIYMIANRATICALFVSITIFVVRIYWRLRIEMWFWILIIVIFTIDMMTLFLVPAGRWPNGLIVLAPIAVIQLTISIFLISTVDSAIQKIKSRR